MEGSRGALRVKEVTQASGAGGTIYCSLQPPEGEVWDVYLLTATHDDVARTIDWIINDDITALKVVFTQAAATLPRYFYNDVGTPIVPVRVNHNCYIVFRVNAMAGAKTITMEALIERIVGVPTWKSA